MHTKNATPLLPIYIEPEMAGNTLFPLIGYMVTKELMIKKYTYKRFALSLSLLLFSSCYSEYKTVLPKPTDVNAGLKISAGVNAIGIFPVIPKTYYANVTLKNTSGNPVRLSAIHLTLNRSAEKTEKLLFQSVDSLLLNSGDSVDVRCKFANHSPLFFPHRVSLTLTARAGQKTIQYRTRFKRYRYVNLAGN